MKNDHVVGPSNKINVVEEQVKEHVAMVSHLHVSMITKLHMASFSKNNDWWYDYGAIVHICNNKNNSKTMRLLLMDKKCS